MGKWDYRCAVTPNGADHSDNAETLAIRWITAAQRSVGGEVLLYVPQKSNLGRNGTMRSFGGRPGVVVGTARGPVTGWAGGPVLAAWPTRLSLMSIADDRRTRALCVVPWIDGEIAAWQRAANPELLGDAQSTSASDAALHPVVVQGLTALSGMVNHGNNLAGGYDRRDAVAVLRTLHQGGYQLPDGEVYAWTLAHGWPARGAERLRDLAEKIDAGRTVQLRGGSPLRPDVLDRWRAQAAGDESSAQ